MSFIIRVAYTDENLTKAMRFDSSKTVREILFEAANNFSSNCGCEVLDVVNFNFKYEPEDQMIPPTESAGDKTGHDPNEAFWLKKMKVLDSYNFSNGVTLRFERNSNFNLSVQEARKTSGSPSPDAGRLQLSGENEKVKFLTKGRFTRNQAAGEIVTTEQTYVEQLSVLLEHFIEPSFAKDLVPSGNISTMFKHVKMIYGLHKELLREMEERVQNMSNATQLGDLFLQLMPFMKMYGEYCLNYEDNINELYDLAASDKTLQAWIKEVEAKEEFSLNNVGAYLIVPVQRIPRYRLLFEQLLKLTPKTHPDYEKLTNTLEKVNEIATFVNNYQDEDKKLREVREQIDGCPVPIMQPGRKLLYQGVIKKVSSRATQERMVFLFSDLIVYCVPKKVPYQYKGHIPLDASIWVKGVTGNKIKNAIQLVAESKTYTFAMASDQEKYQWNQAISAALASLCEKSPSVEKNKMKVHDRGGLWSLITKSDKLKNF